MHEFSLMTQVVENILKEVKSHKANKVNKVYLEIGELLFCAKEQLEFVYQVLTEKTILENSKLIIKEKKAKVKCTRCDYNGGIKYVCPVNHHSFPNLLCPECNGEIKIIEGKECVIKKIDIIVKG